ncbi:MAG: hypothetical protein V4739_17165, partial [Pseudomonadota bacterium]
MSETFEQQEREMLGHEGASSRSRAPACNQVPNAVVEGVTQAYIAAHLMAVRAFRATCRSVCSDLDTAV